VGAGAGVLRADVLTLTLTLTLAQTCCECGGKDGAADMPRAVLALNAMEDANLLAIASPAVADPNPNLTLCSPSLARRWLTRTRTLTLTLTLTLC
jgi:hypothetical protein